jgi:GR25 family glycosyltransferase involved in LPS biosynthesis
MFPGYYINLDSREDRRNYFELLRKHIPLLGGCERFSAISHTNGAIGCGLSHIECLTKCLEKDSEICMIIEDDLCFFNQEKLTQFQELMKDETILNNSSWDIIVLTPRGDDISGDTIMEEKGFRRIRNNQTTTGYIIRKRFISKLIENLKECVDFMLKGENSNIYAIDQYWKHLQDIYEFYYFKKVFAGQLPSYSDIEKRNVNYNHRYIQQEFM